MNTLKTFLFPWPLLLRTWQRPLLADTGRPIARIFLPLVLWVVAVWFVTVPVHELLHVAGCLLGGGSVEELTIQPIYGGTLLSRLFPFVTAGGDYAGQLTTFDTRGSDVTYLLTVWFPFVLTVLLGFSGLALAGHTGRAVFHGIGTVHSFLPAASVTGDFYELGSILATRLMGMPAGSEQANLIRGDDLGRVFSRVSQAGLDDGLLTIILGILIGLALITLTIDLSIAFSRLVLRKSLEM